MLVIEGNDMAIRAMGTLNNETETLQTMIATAVVMVMRMTTMISMVMMKMMVRRWYDDADDDEVMTMMTMLVMVMRVLGMMRMMTVVVMAMTTMSIRKMLVVMTTATSVKAKTNIMMVKTMFDGDDDVGGYINNGNVLLTRCEGSTQEVFRFGQVSCLNSPSIFYSLRVIADWVVTIVQKWNGYTSSIRRTSFPVITTPPNLNTESGRGDDGT